MNSVYPAELSSHKEPVASLTAALEAIKLATIRVRSIGGLVVEDLWSVTGPRSSRLRAGIPDLLAEAICGIACARSEPWLQVGRQTDC
jgi:hypothetical protein